LYPVLERILRRTMAKKSTYLAPPLWAEFGFSIGTEAWT
jgi:hypothetical protein